jgi:hypothetical protein
MLDGSTPPIRSGGIVTAALLALLAVLALIHSIAAATLTGKADIVDGDTIKVGGIPVRLYGIDAPEARQTCERDGKTYGCGKQATKELAKLITGQTLQCEVMGRDDSRRRHRGRHRAKQDHGSRRLRSRSLSELSWCIPRTGSPHPDASSSETSSEGYDPEFHPCAAG